MKTLLCTIGRKENRYIREFVEHYKKLGFTNIALYDNNYDGEDDFHDSIGDYIDEGFVILIDYRNRKKCQFDAYNGCYMKYGNAYDWIAFFDCDEFLELNKEKFSTIDDYLSYDGFKDFDMIHVNWFCYGDNGLLRYEDKPVQKRFNKHIEPINFKKTYDFPENEHVKTILRGGLKNVTFCAESTPHTCFGVEKCCNNCGMEVDGELWHAPCEFSFAYLKHYTTKSTEEYAEKILRGFPDSIVDQTWYAYLVDLYYRVNERTEEKDKIFEEKLNVKFGRKRKDVQLFMLCYDKKEYDFVDNAVMTPIQCGAYNGKDICRLKDNTWQNISRFNFFFAELTGIYWIWRNITDAKYKGNTQYRRRLVGVDETMDYDDVFSKYDIVCAKPYNYPENKNAFIPEMTVADGYAYSHCKDDLDTLERVVKDLLPKSYGEVWDRCITNGEDLYYSNGFVMTAEKYDEYCQFLFSLLTEWMKYSGIHTYEDVIVHVARNIGAGKYKRFEIEKRDPMKATWNEISWQCKIGGFLSERILTLWIEHNIPKERRYEVEYEKMEEMYI